MAAGREDDSTADAVAPPDTVPAEVDVLVIGGGLAGCMAALSAREAGARVALAVKGRLGGSGSSSKAAGIIAAPVGGVDIAGHTIDDTPALHAEDTLAIGCGLNAPALVAVLAAEAGAGLDHLRRLGVRFSEDTATGRPVQLQAPGNRRPRACSVLGGGAALIATLGARIRASGIIVLEACPAASLVRDGDRVAGAVLSSGHGRAPVRAGATVLAAGGATGLFPTLSGDPRNAGDGVMLGFAAGAAVANLEFVEFTLIYRVRGTVLRIAGLAPFLSRGARLIAGSAPDLEIDVLARHHPGVPPASIGRAEVIRAVIETLARGHDPVRLDCRHFSPAVWEEFEASQGAAVLEPIRAAGGDPRTEPIEVLPAAHSMLAGLVIDPSTRTTVPGLYAAGECATGVHGAARLSGNGLGACLVFGRRAGSAAAAEALAIRGAPDSAGPGEAAGARRGLGAEPPPPVSEQSGASLDAIAAGLADAMQRGLSPVRSAETLEALRADLTDLNGQLDTIDAGYAGADLRARLQLAGLMAEAALRRTESRGLHFRSDCPEPDPCWRTWQTVTRDPDTGTLRWGSLDPDLLGRA